MSFKCSVGVVKAKIIPNKTFFQTIGRKIR